MNQSKNKIPPIIGLPIDQDRILELMESGIPFITAVVIEQDEASAKYISTFLDKRPAKDLLWMIGSYARFDWATKHLTKEEITELMPDLWISSDPDDSNYDYLQYFTGQGLDELPDRNVFEVYRGQIKDKLGFSWTLDEKVAEKFANYGGGRAKIDNGEVITRVIHRSKIKAYLTSRGEKEIIYDPRSKN